MRPDPSQRHSQSPQEPIAETSSLKICMQVLFLCALVSIPAACKQRATRLNLTTVEATPVLPKLGDLSQQTEEQAQAKSVGCVSCHIDMDAKTMHESTAVVIGCTDCHGGDSKIMIPPAAKKGTETYNKAMLEAHVQPRLKDLFTSSANPKQSGAKANQESWEFIRFMNPGDLRVADLSCGTAGCHVEEVDNVRKSMMTHGSHLWGAALYNNGSFPLKRGHFGEAYARDGRPARLQTVPPPTEQQTRDEGVLPYLNPLPRWEVGQPSNMLRVFERGGRKPPDGIALITQHSLPGGAAVGFEHDDEPGRVVLNRLSQRGLGTLNRTDPVWLNLQKTRLLDPTLNHLGSNDKPGDYRSSGCTACHTIYANDRDPAHSGPYAKFGNRGQSAQKDPTIDKKESGHPIQHMLTSAIPSSQCVVCHMHPGTSVTQSYYGYMWWDNESHGDLMYPKTQKSVSAKEFFEKTNFNPEGSVTRGLWGELDFLLDMTSLNEQMKDRLNPTQFADFHGHGWIYKAVYKQNKKGQLLDKEGAVIDDKDPDKLAKAVHLKDIHLEKGMHCVDCHFQQDMHGNGKLYGAMRNAIEIDCVDCHGTISARPTLKTSGPAAGEEGTDMSLMTTPSGRKRFQWRGKKLLQRSNVDPDLEWEIVQTVDTVTPGAKFYNEQSALAKTIQKDGKVWGDPTVAPDDLAHSNQDINCYTCHTSWMTSCFGCHLPMRANKRRETLHNESQTTRNWTSYSFQTLREDVFMLGRDDHVMGRKYPGRKDKNAGRITTTRSACAVYVGSQNANREWVYSQQQTVSSEGLSGHAFAPSYAHTIRGKGGTRLCKDCHISEDDDNNAMMAMLTMQGTNAYNFFGRYVYTANGNAGVSAIAVGEREEPQAVIGSTLHKYAYPEEYQNHLDDDKELSIAYSHSAEGALDLIEQGTIFSVQHRGEYLYCASGKRGLQIFDIANIDNKGFSQRITSAPFSPLGQSLHVDTSLATFVATPTTLGVDPTRQHFEENMEGDIHPLYAYLYVTDYEEGLIFVNVATLLDGDPANNSIEATLRFNEGGRLNEARHVTIAGNFAYVLTNKSLVTVQLDFDGLTPTPKITSELPIAKPKSFAVQFRYGFLATKDGLQTLDMTDLAKPKLIDGAFARVDRGAQSVYVVRTYAYCAARDRGFAIIDLEKPEQPKLIEYFDGDGQLKDTRDVKVGITNASYFAYVADGKDGFDVVQLTSPDYTPGAGGFAVKPTPKHIASYQTGGLCLSVEEGIDRDRAADESGNQIAVFGRIGSRPLNKEEIQRMYLRDGKVWKVSNDPPSKIDADALRSKIQKSLGEEKKARKGRRGRRGRRKPKRSSKKKTTTPKAEPKAETKAEAKQNDNTSSEPAKPETKSEAKTENKEATKKPGKKRRRRRRRGSSSTDAVTEPKKAVDSETSESSDKGSPDKGNEDEGKNTEKGEEKATDQPEETKKPETESTTEEKAEEPKPKKRRRRRRRRSS